MTTQLATSLLEETNRAHAEFLALGGATEEKVREWVNKGREVGVYLLTIKSQSKNWEQLALEVGGKPEQGKLGFTEAHGRLFIRLADKLPEPAKDPVEAMSALKDVMMLQGLLALPDGHGPQQLHKKDVFGAIVRHAMQIQAVFNHDLKDELPNLSDERKQNLRDQIEPVVRIYEQLAPAA